MNYALLETKMVCAKFTKVDYMMKRKRETQIKGKTRVIGINLKRNISISFPNE